VHATAVFGVSTLSTVCLGSNIATAPFSPSQAQ
jgi:hypothetical protein